MKPKMVMILFITLFCLTLYGGVSSYVVVDNNGLDTDVFLSAPMIYSKDASFNLLMSIKRVGLELEVATPLLMGGISVTFCLTENFDLMIKQQDFSPGFGVGFSLRF